MNKYQIFPPLTEEEYQELKISIENNGILVPVEYDESGAILDGHHRVQICEDLGIKDYPSIIRAGLSEEEKIKHIFTVNAHRRHLNGAKKEAVLNLRMQGYSYRTIGEIVGISHVTAYNWTDQVLNELTPGGPQKVEGKDGKNYPSKKSSIVAKNQREQQRALEAIADIPSLALPGHMTDVKRTERIAREYKAQELRESIEPASFETPDLQMLYGDFRDISNQIQDNSVDLIFTDPPYPKEYLPLWSDLSLIARRILKPGCLMVAYSGQFHLPEVMQRLSEHLDYIWMGSLVLAGPHNNVQARHIHNHSKPLLFYGKEFTPGVWFSDTYNSEGRTKDKHDWQQAEGAALYYIDALTEEGNIVFDPFLGSGTTGSAAVKLNRSFIGCDNDKSALVQAIGRVNNGTGREVQHAG